MSYNGALGIDLGTSYACVGVWRNERVEIVANDQGSRLMPSWVAFTDSERLAGDAAKNQAALNPSNTVFDVKRMIGRSFSDPAVQSDARLWPFKVVAGSDGGPRVLVQLHGEERRFSPEELCAVLLTKLRDAAEAHLRQKVTKAVLTVPAFFNDAQRQCTKDAAAIAGLEVVRILNEPTAAAIAYGLHKSDGSDGEKHVLIADLGGGTLDVSLVSIEEGIFEVKASRGNSQLGGKDFDDRLVRHMVDAFRTEHGRDLTASPRALQRLRGACERAKRLLSTQAAVSVEIKSLFDGVDFAASITRERFEELCDDLFRTCMQSVQSVLWDARMQADGVDEVVLVGGGSRMPKLRQLVRDFFGGKELAGAVNPGEAVAYGAAVQGAILTRGCSAPTSQCLLIDVLPFSIGIESAGGIMMPLIRRGTAIPVKKTQVFSTYIDQQPEVCIQIFEGERVLCKDCHKLGAFQVRGLAPAPRGVPKIHVTFDVDANGILNVTAVDQSTAAHQSLQIQPPERGRLSRADVEAMHAEADRWAEADRAARERVEARLALESRAGAIRNRADEGRGCPEDGKRFRAACEDALGWLAGAPEASAAECDARRRELERVCAPLAEEAVGPPSAPARAGTADE
eukprot:TRINITY_DN9445_c0_g2_i1.p1 TRINITY_DN9445_c0_g2~~TRINITY_DN9445_c0_g2_i1.p1  ORF type:complete len:648 (+),score=200.77 TRINITY_DN9445_c0_g2_i1:69-1946(+)